MRPDIAVIVKALKVEFDRHRMPVVDLVQVTTHDPYKVLVATILSARTQDQTTARAAERLFERAPDLQSLRLLSTTVLARLIFPVGFYKNKARFLHELPSTINVLFKGTIPHTVEELIQLPGVGRKTANLVVCIGFNLPAICVDVHVHRICNRLGYLKTANPLQTEMALRAQLPKRFWLSINSLLVSFGQHTCRPVNPHCDRCGIYRQCGRVGVTTTHARKDRNGASTF